MKGIELACTQSLYTLLPVNGFGFTGNVTRVFAKTPAISTVFLRHDGGIGGCSRSPAPHHF